MPLVRASGTGKSWRKGTRMAQLTGFGCRIGDDGPIYEDIGR